jgi:hypothetical protein
MRLLVCWEGRKGLKGMAKVIASNRYTSIDTKMELKNVYWPIYTRTHARRCRLDHVFRTQTPVGLTCVEPPL